MRWPPWLQRTPDPDAARRDRAALAENEALEKRTRAAIARADLAKKRAEHIIRENHLAPRIALALREPQ